MNLPILPFATVTQAHADARKVPGLENLSLQQFAQMGNQATGTNIFDLGNKNPFLTGLMDLSEGINYALEKVGAPELGSAVGGTIGGWLGNEELGREVGKGLPRGLVNMLPLFVPGGQPLALGMAGGLSGLDMFSQTGSGPRALLAGATTAAIPTVFGKMNSALFDSVGAPLASVADNAALGIPARFATNVGAGFGIGVVSDLGDIALAPERQFSEVLDSDYWRRHGVMSAAFLPFDIQQAIHPYTKSGAAQLEQQRSAQLTQYAVDKLQKFEPIDVGTSRQTLPEVDLDKISSPWPRPGDEQAPVVEPEVADAPRLGQDAFRLSMRPEETPTTYNQFPLELEPISYVGAETPMAALGGKDATGSQSVPSERLMFDFGTAQRELPKVMRNAAKVRSAEIEPVVNKEPTTVEEYGQQLKAVDDTREQLDQPPVTDGEMKAAVEAELDRGTSPEEAPNRALQRKKNKVAKAAKAVDVPDALLPAEKDFLMQLESVAERNPEARKAVAYMQKRMIKASGDPDLVMELKGQWDDWFDTTAGVGALGGLQNRLNNAARRLRDRKGDKAQTVGRRSNMEAEGRKLAEDDTLTREEYEAIAIRDAMEKVSKWKPEDQAELEREYNKFLRNNGNAAWGEDAAKLGMRGMFASIEAHEQGKKVKPGQIFAKIREKAEKDWRAEMNRKGIINKEEIDEFGDIEGQAAWEEGGGSTGDWSAEMRLGAAKGLSLFWNVPEFQKNANGTMQFGKLQTAKDGTLAEASLGNLLGWNGKPVKGAELELWKLVVPEAFDGKKVNMQKLVDGLAKAEPVVETKEFSSAQENRLFGRLVHEFETAGYQVEDNYGEVSVTRNGTDVEFDELPPQLQRLAEHYENTYNPDGDTMRNTSGTRYQTIAPKAERDMPGYVETLVRLPATPTQGADKVTLSGNRELYRGPHFGSDDTNVVTFFRGYEETLPNGEKAFHVIELQSDWAQAQRRAVKAQASLDETGGRWMGKVPANHPLLPVYESLGLKAAIAHAKKIGATKLILSDAETAMMSEGHDRQGAIQQRIVAPKELESFVKEGDNRYHFTEETTTPTADGQRIRTRRIKNEVGQVVADFDIDSGQLFGIDSAADNGQFLSDLRVAGIKLEPLEPTQAAGMRLHYDKTMPKELQRLTGSKGEAVELGVHAKPPKVRGIENGPDAPARSEGSPVFRTPEGTPKTQITGRSYDLSNVSDSASLLIGSGGQQRLTQAAPRILENLGHTPSNARQLSNAALGALRVFERLTGDRVAVGEVRGKDAPAGLAEQVQGNRRVYINNLEAPQVRDFVMLHELLGHHFDNAFSRKQLDERTAKAYAGARSYMERLAPNERAEVLTSLAREFVPAKVRNAVEDTIRRTAGDFDESIANLNAILSFGLKNKSVSAESLRWVPQEVRTFMARAWQWVKDVMEGAGAILKWQRLKGEVGGEAVMEFAKFRKELNSVFKEDVRAQLDMLRMDPTMPGGIARMQEALDAGVIDLDQGGTVGAAAQAMFLNKEMRAKGKRALMPFLNQLNAHPAMKNVQKMIPGEQYHHVLMAREFRARLLGEQQADGSVKVLKDGGPLGRIVADKTQQHLLSDLLLRANKTNTNLLELQRTNPAQFDVELSRFDPKYRGDVVEALQRMQDANASAQRFIQEAELNATSAMYGLMLRHNGSKLTQDELSAVSRQAVEAYRDYRVTGDQVKFNAFLQQVGLDGNLLMKFVDPFLNRLAKMQQFWQQNPHYITERRMRQYAVSYNDGQKQNGFADFDTFEAAQAFVKDITKKGGKVFFPDNGIRDQFAKGRAGREGANYLDMLDTATDKTIIPALEQLANQGVMQGSTLDAIKGLLMEQKAAFHSEVRDVDFTNVEVTRKFAPGREYLNMIEQQQMWLNNLSRSVPKRVTNALMEFERHNPEITGSQKNLELFEDAKVHLDNYRTPDSRAGQLATQANFINFLGFNVSNMLIEATQFPFNLSPMLTSKGASMGQSYSIPTKVAGWVLGKNTSGRYSTGIDVEGRDLGQQIESYMDARGQTGLGQFQEINDIAMETQLDLTAFGKTGRPKGKEWLTKPVGAYLNLVRKLYGTTANFNEKLAVMSAFEMMRQNELGGKSSLTKTEFNELMERAVIIGKSASGGFGRSGRPVGWFQNEGGWRSMAQATYSLSSYNSAHLSNLYNYLKVGFGKDLEGFTPQQRSQARKAAFQAFGTMIGAVGVIGGIPFLGPLLRLLEDNSELELEKNAREFFASLGDEESGPIIADLAMHGAVYAAGAPFDVSTRIAPGGILGANAYEGWSPQALLGPAFSQGEQYVRAAKSALQGDWTKATEHALPVGFKRAFSLAANEGNIVDQQGNLLFRPTTAEAVMSSLGLNTRRQTMLREMQRIQATSARIQSNRNQRAYKEAAELAKTQGGLAARRYLMQHAQETAGFSSKAATAQVAKQLASEQYGYDPTRVGGVQTAQAMREVLGTFGAGNFEPVSETQRVMDQARLMASMGVPPTSLDSAIQQAVLVDALVQRSGLPVAAARLVAGQVGSDDPERVQSAQAFLPF